MADKMAKSLRDRASKMFEEMSEHFHDAGEVSEYGSPMSVGEPRKYYPTITIPVDEDDEGYEKEPGDECNLLVKAVVKSKREGEITVEIKEFIDFPAKGEEDEEEGEED